MDNNKLQVLRDVGYFIPPSCRICVHGCFERSGDDWGTCKRHTYDHIKHQETRQLSIHKNGSCRDVEIDQSKMVECYGAFTQFTGVRQ